MLTAAFQSTPPVKAATTPTKLTFIGYDVSIHAAREGGDVHSADKAIYVRVSIHAAREGGDIHRHLSG